MIANTLPTHLKRYLTEQDYSRYSWVDQAVWRFIMRRLTNYLSQTAHECYLEGLEKTGISTEYIPKISEMSAKLSQYGWKAVAVSGFIPPAAFMELQSLSILPIACDIRALEHAMYTPAPDIVHEAAGHAPILIQPEFSAYLHEYASAAKKAILNKEDLEVYAAIRELSDLKEDPNSTPEQIRLANQRLESAVANSGDPSEAALLARMNWWTAEYGLIGSLDNPKIYGAGLLSSVGESVTALHSSTKKLPFSLKCLEFTYDITEPQPQLFVTSSFQVLTQALREFANQMAFKTGGLTGLEKAKKSETVNTVELDSGIQISGKLVKYFTVKNTVQNDEAYYLQFEGPCQLATDGKEILNQGRKQHLHGYSTPVGPLITSTHPLHSMSEKDLEANDIKKFEKCKLQFLSGVVVEGVLKELIYNQNKLVVMKFTNCTVTNNNQTLFKPDWGEFDMAVGSSISSVFGGAADREAYGSTDDFIAKKVIPPKRSAEYLALNEIFGMIRNLREKLPPHQDAESKLGKIIERLNKDFPKDWLTRLEILELCVKNNLNPNGLDTIQSFIARRSDEPTIDGQMIKDGLRLIEAGV